MNGFLKIAVLSAMVLVIGNGCASYMVYKNSEQKVAAKKAFAKGDQAAIKAVQLGNDGVGIGVDVSNWEALSEQPLMQLGAAILDAGMIYAGKRGIDSLNSKNSDKGTTINVNGSENNTTVVNGDGNTTTSSPNIDSDNGNQ